MNTQEAYERIRAHFLTDGRYGYDRAKEVCRYLTNTGAKCAVGCLIPDGSPLQQSKLTAIALPQSELGDEWERVFGDTDVSFLNRAQMAHDESAMADFPIGHFIARLDSIAASAGLQVVSV
jgi:hypothetical protein